MAFRPYRKIPVSDQQLSLLQDNIVDSLGSLTTCPMLAVQHIPKASLSTGINQFSHGLGRAYKAWWAASYDTSIQLRELASPDRNKYLVVQASGPVLADIFVL